MKWNDNMDEAPRDGTRFLSYLPSVPHGFEDWSMVDCWWDASKKTWETPYVSDEDPTHWMPLPEPPK